MIHDYSYKPSPRFQDVPGSRTKLFFGFELEIEADRCDQGIDELSDKVHDKAPFTYCKHDGSLDDGFEVVSHPMSWKWIKRNEKKLAELLGFLDKAGAKSYDTTTCGLHIHVSKAGLGDKVLGSMLRFVFKEHKFILKISRRKKEDLDHWACAHIRDEYEREEAMKPHGDKERRLALNTLPRNTAEFRLFRGTLAPDGFMRAMEFCHSLIMAIKAKRGDITVDEYAAFVHSEKKEYPHLEAFLTRKGIGVPAGQSAAVAAPAARAANADGLPTASMLCEGVLTEILADRLSGMTWSKIEERHNLRRANGMTAVHAYHRAMELAKMERSAAAS